MKPTVFDLDSQVAATAKNIWKRFGPHMQNAKSLKVVCLEDRIQLTYDGQPIAVTKTGKKPGWIRYGWHEKKARQIATRVRKMIRLEHATVVLVNE